jgi:hypothetical protein
MVGAVALLGLSSHATSGPLREVQRIALPDVVGRIDHMAFDPHTQRVFLAALYNQTVEVIGLQEGRHLTSLKGFGEPQGLVFIGERHELLITDGAKREAVVVNTDNFRLRKSITLRSDPDNAREDRAAGRVYVGAGAGSNGALEVLTVDRWHRESEIAIALPGHPESFQLEHNGPRIFINVPEAHAVVVVDRSAAGLPLRWSIPAQGNFPMALDERRGRLFIGARRPARLLVLDVNSGRTIASLQAVGDADDVFCDESSGRIFVSGGEGYVQVFGPSEANHYVQLETLPTRRGARTSLLLKDEQLLLVPVPRDGEADAELRVFSTED